MLEKSRCKILVSKLRAILLLETELNALHKIIFNQRILIALEQHTLIPIEIVGRRKILDAIHIEINKKLKADISNQFKTLSVVISTDNTNFYDRVA